MEKKDVFMMHTLSNGDEVTLLRINGGHLMEAMFIAGKNANLVGLYTICASTLVKGKQMTKEYFEELDISDAMFLMNNLHVQSEKLNM